MSAGTRRLIGALCLLAMGTLFAHDAMAILHPAEIAPVEEHEHDDCAPDGCSASTECCHGHCVTVFFADAGSPHGLVCPALSMVIPSDCLAPEPPVKEIEHPPQRLS